MRYCNTCILPDTRPNLKIMDDGRCNACHSWSDKKENIDWTKREQDFQNLVSEVKAKNAEWDCVIPVSGGKDSTWQTIKALEYGLKPLCVTWNTPARNEIGQRNLNNLIALGVDHIDFTINPKVEKELTLRTFIEKGAMAISMHLALFAIPQQIAIRFGIPLVLWGENSGIEYGGDDQEALGFRMNEAWLKAYGVTNGTTAKDWAHDGLTMKDLAAYRWPSDEELEKAGVTAAFLGWYFEWDPEVTKKVAEDHGFKALEGAPKTGLYDYADIDDEFLIGLHHWVKWYKFGFTRLWDNLSLEIRSGRITREDAIKIVRETGEEFPEEAIEKFCAWADITKPEFMSYAEKFRNEDIWVKKGNHYEIEDFLIEDWAWHEN